MVFAKGKNAPQLVINFFLEQPNAHPGQKLTFEWMTAIGKKHFKVASEFKTDQIVAQRPFPSPHAETEYGMIFKLDRRGQEHLRILTADTRNHGSHLIVFMNNKPLDMLRIDKAIDDGLICVWRGLAPSDVHKADNLVPRIGEDAKTWKKRRKEEIKAAKDK